MKTQDFVLVSGLKSSWQVFAIVQGIGVDKKIGFRLFEKDIQSESNQNQIHWWRKIEISFGTLIHFSIHIKHMQTERGARERRSKENQTWKNTKKVPTRFHCYRPIQDSLTIPFASWDCRQAKSIKTKHFQALYRAVSPSRHPCIFKFGLHDLGIDSMN